jgi:hypothetical protein
MSQVCLGQKLLPQVSNTLELQDLLAVFHSLASSRLYDTTRGCHLHFFLYFHYFIRQCQQCCNRFGSNILLMLNKK